MSRRATAGIGFKPQHFEEAAGSRSEGLWFEVHAENYMVEGGPRLVMLEVIRCERPLSLHGVGLSLAGDEDPDPVHLDRLRVLADRFEPFIVSEHLAWSRRGPICIPDLLPFPRTCTALDRICRNVELAQDALGREIAIENPALYLELPGHELSETELLRELVGRTGCKLLIDLNNVYVSATNLHFDPHVYLDALPFEAIAEIHLAGHSEDPELGRRLLVDSHDSPVAEPVWALYRYLLARAGPRPTLVERDGNVPPFVELAEERDRAARMLGAAQEPACA